MENTLQNSKDRLFIKLNSFVVAMMISAQTITGTIVRIPAFKDFHNNFIILVIALTIIFAEIIYYSCLYTFSFTKFKLNYHKYRLF